MYRSAGSHGHRFAALGLHPRGRPLWRASKTAQPSSSGRPAPRTPRIPVRGLLAPDIVASVEEAIDRVIHDGDVRIELDLAVARVAETADLAFLLDLHRRAQRSRAALLLMCVPLACGSCWRQICCSI
jgi:ABC-type transporter Mla MlaB component